MTGLRFSTWVVPSFIFLFTTNPCFGDPEEEGFRLSRLPEADFKRSISGEPLFDYDPKKYKVRQPDKAEDHLIDGQSEDKIEQLPNAGTVEFRRALPYAGLGVITERMSSVVIRPSNTDSISASADFEYILRQAKQKAQREGSQGLFIYKLRGQARNVPYSENPIYKSENNIVDYENRMAISDLPENESEVMFSKDKPPVILDRWYIDPKGEVYHNQGVFPDGTATVLSPGHPSKVRSRVEEHFKQTEERAKRYHEEANQRQAAQESLASPQTNSFATACYRMLSFLKGGVVRHQ
jgi:hypothetical protein